MMDRVRAAVDAFRYPGPAWPTPTAIEACRPSTPMRMALDAVAGFVSNPFSAHRRDYAVTMIEALLMSDAYGEMPPEVRKSWLRLWVATDRKLRGCDPLPPLPESPTPLAPSWPPVLT